MKLVTCILYFFSCALSNFTYDDIFRANRTFNPLVRNLSKLMSKDLKYLKSYSFICNNECLSIYELFVVP